MNTELRVYLHKQMHMVGHDFHLYDVNMKLITDFFYKLIQSCINTIDQDLTAVFWTPDHMIFARVHHIMITFVFHANIIQQTSI